MKKVFYNKYIKVLEIICILIAVGVLSHKGIEIKKWSIERDEYEEQLTDIRYEEKLLDSAYRRMAGYIEELVMKYKESGKNGIAEYFEGTPEKFKDYRMIASSDEGTYIFPYSFFYPSYQGSSFRDYTVREYQLWEDNTKTLHLRLSSSFYCGVKNGVDGKLVEESTPLEGYLSQETIDYLKSINYSLKMKIAIDYGILMEDIRYEELNLAYGDPETKFYEEMFIFVVCGIFIIGATVLLIISCVRNPDEKKELNYWEKSYCELHIITAGAVVASAITGAVLFFEEYENILPRYIDIVTGAVMTGILLAVLIFYYEAGVIIKKMINKRFRKDWYMARVLLKLKKWMSIKCKKLVIRIRRFMSGRKAAFKSIYDSSKYAQLPEIKKLYVKKVMADVLVLLVDIAIIIMVVGAWGNYGEEYVYAVAVMMGIFTIFYITLSIKEYKHLRIYNKVAQNINLIYNGEFTQVAAEPEEKHELLNCLVNLSAGFKDSVAKQVEAEKLQIELVANVSHDLKTPLTSIISYVDLLSKEELSPVAADYVKVLEDKSSRLKDIVADVFDLAKASSGERVIMEQLNGVVLVNQVLSDMSDRIEESGKELKVKLDVDAAPITGNGQKLYRVFQNIIDNALKYSMPGTRIYLSGEYREGQFVVSLKNVSEYEIDFTEKEILSRFTRGDKARHSEGNGLGLSIAKSFTELCGGTFGIEIDGDVFKVNVVLR